MSSQPFRLPSAVIDQLLVSGEMQRINADRAAAPRVTGGDRGHANIGDAVDDQTRGQMLGRRVFRALLKKCNAGSYGSDTDPPADEQDVREVIVLAGPLIEGGAPRREPQGLLTSENWTYTCTQGAESFPPPQQCTGVSRLGTVPLRSRHGQHRGLPRRRASTPLPTLTEGAVAPTRR